MYASNPGNLKFIETQGAGHGPIGSIPEALAAIKGLFADPSYINTITSNFITASTSGTPNSGNYLKYGVISTLALI